MAQYNWDFDAVLQSFGPLARGLVVTVELTVANCLLGTLLAIPLAAAMRSQQSAIKWVAVCLVELFKAVPLLVLLVWIHYVLPGAIGVRTSAFWNAVIAFSLSHAAFLADIFRGGMASVPTGHIEAAKVLGLSPRAVTWRVLIPETIRRSLPAVSAMYITAFKMSSLASAIGVSEALFEIRMRNLENPAPLEHYSALALVFIAFVIPASSISRRLERHPWLTIEPRTQK